MLQEPEVTSPTESTVFFREYYPKLYAFISAATGLGRGDVEDLVQETLLQAWRDRGEAAPQGSPLGWILGIARHRIADFFRARRRREDAQGVLQALSRLESERIPDEILARREMGRRVRQALHDISPDYSTILLKRYLDGWTVRQIAEQSGQSQDAMESRLRRAHEALRKVLEAGVERHE